MKTRPRAVRPTSWWADVRLGDCRIIVSWISGGVI
jgi:hypothetical protein